MAKTKLKQPSLLSVRGISNKQRKSLQHLLGIKNSFILGTALWLVIGATTSCTHKTDRKLTSSPDQNPPEVGFTFDGSEKNVIKNFVRFKFAENEITTLCNKELENYRTQFAQWREKYPAHQIDVKALIDFESMMADHSDQMQPLLFISSISPHKNLRDEAVACEEKSAAADNEIFTSRANYLILRKIRANAPAERRLLSETLLAFDINGMKLDDEKLAEFKKLKDQLSQLETRFNQNLTNDTSKITARQDELTGAPEDFLARLKKAPNGDFEISTKGPDYLAVMENVKNAEVRRRMYFAYNNRQAEANTPLLQEATAVREKMGKLLGFKNYADYVLQNKMAKSTQNVESFLADLRNRLSKKNKQELAVLQKFKQEELQEKSPIQVWDVTYISNQLMKKKYRIDHEKLKEYFPADFVVQQTFEIYSQLLGIEFKKVQGLNLWAPQVDLYEIRDQKTKSIIAYFYADLFPREGKYGHAAAFPLKTGRVLGENGLYNKPVAAIVTNFNPPSPGKPSLLSHQDVETFFHEFGHIMHFTLTEAKFASLSGFSVKQDFVEAPSQMLENWVWQKQILQKMSSHYARPNDKLPLDLMKNLIESRHFNSGISYTRQLIFALFDLDIHTHGSTPVNESFYKLYNSISGLQAPEGVHFPATFGHMMGGYSAGYYGYLW